MSKKTTKPAPKQTLTARVNANIAALRKERGMSQLAVATAAGVSVSYVSMLERNRRSPPLETCDAIATAMKVPVARLIS